MDYTLYSTPYISEQPCDILGSDHTDVEFYYINPTMSLGLRLMPVLIERRGENAFAKMTATAPTAPFFHTKSTANPPARKQRGIFRRDGNNGTKPKSTSQSPRGREEEEADI